jgi:hypothetical protein
MPTNPQVKFQPDLLSRRRAEKIAAYHSLGVTSAAHEGSANEFAKVVFTQFSLVKPGQFYLALAALKPFQVTNPFALASFGPRQSRLSLE